MPDVWRALYRDALAESDPIKLNGRIERAKRAIHERLQELDDSDSESRERPQLESALHALFTLRTRKRTA
jgi:hypothetical protein